MITTEISHNFNIGSLEIIQRTDNRFFSATYLLAQYKKENTESRRVLDFLKHPQTIKRMHQLLKNPQFESEWLFFEENGGIWLHPGLLYLFLRWLDVDLEDYFWEWFLSQDKITLNKFFNLKNQ